ncbi:MAG: hypothetical protein KME42_13875 [Tildeniella nuda ZEHNDER 1965/U140]|jgi:hypothetical protein|nr:hypothetical protein [Tildeniella nuda ZEHNDER 1965/U140]
MLSDTPDFGSQNGHTPTPPTPQPSAIAKPTFFSKLLFFGAVGGALILPLVTRPHQSPSVAPTRDTPVVRQQLKDGQPVAPATDSPSMDELISTLDKAVVTGDRDFGLLLKIRADQFQRQAQKSSNAEYWLVQTYVAQYNQYIKASKRYGSLSGDAEQFQVIKDYFIDSLACLYALRAVKKGEAVSGKAIAPKEYLDAANEAIAQYSLILGTNFLNPSVPQDEPKSDRKPVAVK